MTVAAVVAALLASLFLLAGPARPASAETFEFTPTMTCVGGDEISKGLLDGIVALEPKGTVIVDTPVTATIDGDPPLLENASYDVDFTWSFTVPPALVTLAEGFGADIYLQEMDLGVTAEGAASGTWQFPEIYPPSGPVNLDEPAVLTTGGTLTPNAQGDIDFTLDSPAKIVVHVPSEPDNSVPVTVDVWLDCTFAPVEIGSILVDGVLVPPTPPLGVTATAGGGLASVSWDPPADDGGQAPSSYLVATSGGGEPLEVSGNINSVDVIGLNPGEEYSFEVVAVNGAGESDPSEPSNTVEILLPGRDFADVPSDHPFFSEIQWMAGTGLSTGYEEDGAHVYLPAATLSRQAMSAFLYRLSGSPDGEEPVCTEAPFTDVPVDHSFCGEIAWMADTGISTGYSDGTYKPADGLSREAMSAFMYRLADSPNGPDPVCVEEPFSDVPVTNAFCGEIAWMAEVGISEGYADGTYKPADTLTRQAMSAFLYRYTLVEPVAPPAAI